MKHIDPAVVTLIVPSGAQSQFEAVQACRTREAHDAIDASDAREADTIYNSGSVANLAYLARVALSSGRSPPG